MAVHSGKLQVLSVARCPTPDPVWRPVLCQSRYPHRHADGDLRDHRRSQDLRRNAYGRVRQDQCDPLPRRCFWSLHECTAHLGLIRQEWIQDLLPRHRPRGPAIFQEWFESHGDETTRALIDPVVKELKAAGIADLAVVGYCFGGKHAIDLAVENEVKVVAVSHPSRVEVPAALEGLLAHSKAPLLINACEFDMAWTAEYQAKATEILGSKYAPGFKQNYYLGCTHGFAIRAELSVPAQKAGLEGAFEETAKWFKKYL